MYSMKRVCLLMALCIYCASAATVQFNYTAGNSTSANWNDASSWVGGIVPLVGDDVEIIGGGQSGVAPQALILPATLPILNSLTLSASDIELQIPTATLTVGTLTLGSNGSIITGAQATGTIILVTTAFVKALDNVNTTSNLQNFNLTIAALATAHWEGDAIVAGLSITNFGTWTWILSSIFTMGTSLDNFGPMTLQYGNNAAVDVATLVINGNVNLWIGSSLVILTNCAFQVGTVQYGGGSVAYNFNIYSSIQIDGTLNPTDNANVSFLAGSTVSGLGAIFYQAATVGSFLYLDIDFNFQNLQLAGLGNVYSNNHTLTLSQLDLAGGTISGTGSILAHNVTSNNYDGNVNAGAGIFLSGRNLTVDQHWDMRSLPNFVLSNGANVITTSSANVFMDCNAYFKQLATDTSAVSVQAGGSWTANIVPSVNATDCQVIFAVPLVASGTFTTPASPNATSTPTAFFPWAGGQISGTFNTPATIGYGSARSLWSLSFENGPFVISSGATFNGGVTPFTTNCSNPQYTNAACYTPGLYSWQAAASGSGIVVSDVGVTFSIDAPGVQFANYWAQSGQIAGANNLTVVNGVRDDTAIGGGSNWQINTTAVAISNTFNMTVAQVSFVNGGSLVVLSSGLLTLAQGINDSANAATPAGVYNYGRTVLSVQQNSFVALAANFWNFGEIDLNTVVTDGTKAKGATLNISRTFSPETNSQIVLNVYSATDADKISWDTSVGCHFYGQITVSYQYTPNPYDNFLALITSTQNCLGVFSIGYSNAPANHTAVMVYDQATTDGTAGTFNYVLLCPNSNTTCLAQGNRNPSKAATVGTVATTGVTSTTSTGSSTAQSTGTSTGAPTTSTANPTTNSPTTTSAATSLFVAPVLILMSAIACLF